MKLFSIFCLLCLAQLGVCAQVPSPETIASTAIQLLGTEQDQEAAIPSLIQIGIPAIPYVASYLSDKDTYIKNAAWRVVDGIGFDAVVSFYISHLSSGDA